MVMQLTRLLTTREDTEHALCTVRRVLSCNKRLARTHQVAYKPETHQHNSSEPTHPSHPHASPHPHLLAHSTQLNSRGGQVAERECGVAEAVRVGDGQRARHEGGERALLDERPVQGLVRGRVSHTASRPTSRTLVRVVRKCDQWGNACV